MKTFRLFLPALLTVSLFTSCKTTAILTSTFENETVGQLPAKNIPGNPAGDEIQYSTELQPRLKVTASSYPGEKALTFTEINTPGLTAHNQFVIFKGISSDFTQPIWYLFSGVHSGSGERVMIDFTDGSAGVITRLHINSAGQLSILTAFPASEEVVGNIPPDTPHTLVISLNMNTGKFNLTVLKSGGNITVTDRPVLGNPLSYANPAHPSINIRWESGASDTRKYVFESVGITRKKPKM
ncbi:hypothetical protein SAMN04487996_10366 [Dyadobacter soli]|uniref:Lipoprotein n=1 Tax=Dyadobacter soli TaxID=659014 RepID=A0A1G6ZBA4_9BACT|nr:hypothetical protein [Dyadobacter soli]SDD99583.1 hypothetical protein SAMN04487996_10366 [Dyadobacter soli]